MVEQVASSLMFCDTAKEVWTQAKELFSGVDNLRRTYDIYQSFFTISQGDDSFEEYYARFRRICNELEICEPLSVDIKVMRRQRERMRVTRFLSGASSAYDSVGNQILGTRDLPPLNEVFSLLRESSTISASSVSTSGRYALTFAVPDISDFSVSRGRGRDRDSGTAYGGRGDSGSNGRNSGRGSFSRGRTSGGGGSGGRGGSGRGRGTRFCTHCKSTSHTVDYCYDLHGFPQAHQVAHSEDTGQFTQSSANSSVTISAEEYQRLMSIQPSAAAASPSTATFAQTGSQDGEEDWWRC